MEIKKKWQIPVADKQNYLSATLHHCVVFFKWVLLLILQIASQSDSYTSTNPTADDQDTHIFISNTKYILKYIQ